MRSKSQSRKRKLEPVLEHGQEEQSTGKKQGNKVTVRSEQKVEVTEEQTVLLSMRSKSHSRKRKLESVLEHGQEEQSTGKKQGNKVTVRSEQKVEVTEEQTVLLSMRSKSQSRKRKLESVLEHGQEEQSTGKKQGNKVTVRSEQKVEVTEEQTVLLSMRSKSQSRKRKLEPVLEHGQEEQSTGKKQGNKVTVRSEQKVEVTEEQTVLLSMRSKSQSRKRKLEPVLEHGQEEQSTGNAGDCVERDNGPVKNNTKHASRFKVKNNGKSIRKEKNGKSLNSSKSISANESNSKKQGIATKQITMMTPCQESMMDGNIPLPEPSTIQGSLSLVSQPVQSEFSCSYIDPSQSIGLSEIKTPHQQPVPEFSTTIPREQQEINVFSLRAGRISQTGAGVKPLGITQLTERHAPVVQISTDPPGCPSLDLQAFKSIKLSQFVRLILAIWLSGRKRSQPPQQALPFSTQSACEQPQHDVVSLGGEEISKTGGEEIVTDIQREPIQRFLQGKDAEQVQMTAISIQKAREAENQKYIDSFVPLTALEINNKIDQPGTAENCVERHKGPVKQSTINALLLKVQSTAKARKKKENARSLNTNKNNSMIPMKKPKRLKKDMENDIRSAEHRQFQRNAAEHAKMTPDIKSQPKVFSKIPAIPKEQIFKFGQTKKVGTFEESLAQMEAADDAANDGNLPDFSKLL